MEFKKFDNEIDASKFAADIVLDLIKNNNKAKLGLATGSTPITLYDILCSDYIKNKTNWSEVKTFNLDEYYGLSIESKASYHYFMNHHLFSKININKSNTYFPSENNNYDNLIKQNGSIDLQILGIGTNGHIGFNEPGSDINSLTRLVDLTKSTIEVNAKKFFNNDISAVPKKAISMGLKSIMQAKKIVLLAFGSSKYDAISKLKKSTKFDPNFPASVLFDHPDVTIIIDKEADIDL